jgi:mannose/fructose/N-acetylgalactosamine-specific phosphotransferase system component IID
MNKKTDKSQTPFVVKENGGSEVGASNKSIRDRVDDIDNIVKAVIIVIVIMVGSMVIATVNVYLDQAHFNAENYNDSSGAFQKKIDSLQSQINSLKSKH